MPVIFEPPKPHDCDLPSASWYRAGAIFACEECKSAYIVRDDDYVNYWVPKHLSRKDKAKYGLD